VRALLIANAGDADAGFVGERFRHHGYAFTECHRERPQEWPALEGHDLVVLLGSEWSVYWPEVANEVGAEVAMVRETHRRGVPLFGICFGSQVMAHALGGTVERARVPEIGWYDVVSDRPEVVADGPWMQWHYDCFTVPPGFDEIARSPVGPQTIVGDHSMATQFHPEATDAMLARWVTGAGAAELDRIGRNPDDLLAQTRANTITSRENSDVLVDWFLESVAR
jgi:GMP synthase-like glutamine amidotransferase